MKKTRKIILLITMIVFISIVSGQNNAIKIIPNKWEGYKTLDESGTWIQGKSLEV